MFYLKKKVREKSRECRNHKPQPFPDIEIGKLNAWWWSYQYESYLFGQEKT